MRYVTSHDPHNPAHAIHFCFHEIGGKGGFSRFLSIFIHSPPGMAGTRYLLLDKTFYESSRSCSRPQNSLHSSNSIPAKYHRISRAHPFFTRSTGGWSPPTSTGQDCGREIPVVYGEILVFGDELNQHTSHIHWQISSAVPWIVKHFKSSGTISAVGLSSSLPNQKSFGCSVNALFYVYLGHINTHSPARIN